MSKDTPTTSSSASLSSLVEVSSGAVFPEDLNKTPHATSTAWKAFVAGGVGGMSLVLAGHPFDLLKVRLQTLRHGPSSGQQPLSAMAMCRHIVKHEGLTGLYRGVLPPILGATPINALAFWSYDFGLRSVRYLHSWWRPPPSREAPEESWSQPIDKETLSLPQIAAAGAISGLFPALLIGPAERIKVLLQVQGTPVATESIPGKPSGSKATSTRAGLVELTRGVYRKEGLRGLFRGTAATFIRDVPGCAVYFTAYEAVRRTLGHHPNSLITLPTPLVVLLAGGLAGIIDWTCTMPIDTLKSRLQSAPKGYYPRGIRDVAKHLIRKEGWTALYRGIAPVMLRAFPANAACFAGYEATMSLLDSWD
ncbi:hypothetical protein IWQ62_001696 [Dispira parvispora]|uniref:Mitochondrial carrier n=1 Tax=Dispira parvispora TaxID=1520584 RepID=A0A9W8ARR6_9FUNG|nr:hypothetical protein IWQ62_001696 [Dispira parvispora]